MMCHAGGRDPLLPEDHEARDFLLERFAAAGATPADARGHRASREPVREERAPSRARRLDVRFNRDAFDVTLERFEGPGGVPRVRLSACRAEVEIREGHLEKLRRLHRVAAATRRQKSLTRDVPSRRVLRAGAGTSARRAACIASPAASHGASRRGVRRPSRYARRRGGVFRVAAQLPLARVLQRARGRGPPFGSLGSFFRFFPIEGAFECNPPFEESLMLRVAKHLTQLLDASTKLERALTFVVVVPHWPERPAWEARAPSRRRTRAGDTAPRTRLLRGRAAHQKGAVSKSHLQHVHHLHADPEGDRDQPRHARCRRRH